MVGCRFQCDFSDRTRSFHTNHSQIYMLGLILTYCTILLFHVQASKENCRIKSISSNNQYCKSQSGNCRIENISSNYQHCKSQPGGVHGLDCYGKHYTPGYRKCLWKPGNISSENTYALIIRQVPKLCDAYLNISELSLEKIRIFATLNMIVEVYENSQSTVCTKAVFSAAPASTLRCDPPYNVSFSRCSGGLFVNGSWEQKNKVKNYFVRYKERRHSLWNLSQCQNGANCTVENLTSSLDYDVQIYCVPDTKCSQCVRSRVYSVPAELTAKPIIEHFNVTDMALREGQRLLSLTWTFPARELYDGFYVTIWKTFGEELCETVNTTHPELTLILSYTAYRLEIRAFNNVSSSAAANLMIPQRDTELSVTDMKLNVSIINETSFRIYWRDNLIQKYVCYSVEWMKKGQKAMHMSFYQNEENHWTVSPLPDPLEPYRRYSLTLHTRPNKDTCNMKHINNSESTYGRTLFYFKEGTPVAAPTNISSFNVIFHSAMLQWSPIPEEDIRGFLLGYMIHYTEYQKTRTRVERNIEVNPDLNMHELENLKSGTPYRVQIAGFTKAGEGPLSSEILFTTDTKEYSNIISTITLFAVLFIVLVFGPLVMKRLKRVLWPSIPNPGKSDAMMKIEGTNELELLVSISTLKVEEQDTNSLQIVEREDMIPASTSPKIPLLHALENEDHAEMTCDWTPCDTDEEEEEIKPDVPPEPISDIPRPGFQSSTCAFPSGYTTMEMFQQGVTHGVPVTAAVTPTMEKVPEDKDSTMGKSRLDYVRHFSTSPIYDDEDIANNLWNSLD